MTSRCFCQCFVQTVARLSSHPPSFFSVGLCNTMDIILANVSTDRCLAHPLTSASFITLFFPFVFSINRSVTSTNYQVFWICLFAMFGFDSYYFSNASEQCLLDMYIVLHSIRFFKRKLNNIAKRLFARTITMHKLIFIYVSCKAQRPPNITR